MKSNNLVDQLKLRRLDEDHFIGGNYDIGTRAIFGGHVLAQAVLAAYEKIPDGRFLHSLHAYFILPGDPGEDIHDKYFPILLDRRDSSRNIAASVPDMIDSLSIILYVKACV